MGNTTSNSASKSASVGLGDVLLSSDQLHVEIAEIIRNDKLSKYDKFAKYLDSLNSISSVAKNNDCFYILKYDISFKDDKFKTRNIADKLDTMDESIISKIRS